jgi:lysine-N-methylase
MQHLVRIDDASEARYARIQLTPSYTCPFLSPNHLCGLQQEHGEFYLPEICATYPRLTQRIDGLRETTLLLSCPEAARLVLLNPNLQPSNDAATPNLPRYHRFCGMGSQPARANGSPHQFFWEVRELILLLLRDRAYPLWQRLFLLGMFCKRLDEITRMHQLAVLPHLLREFTEQGTLRSAMDGMPAQTALQLKVVMEMTTQYLQITDASHLPLRECVRDLCDGIGYHAEVPAESCAASYEDAITRFYRPFVDDHSFIMENYLVNYVFRTRFPYGVDAQGHPSDPFTEYLKMAVLCALVKGLLIGAAARYQKEFSECHVVKVVQSFAKGVEQNPNSRATNTCDSLMPRA